MTTTNTDNKNISNSSSLSPLSAACVEIEKALFGSNYAVIHIQLSLLVVVLISICTLVRKCKSNPIAIHRNLKLLLANIIILYTINSLVWFVFFLRYRILMCTFKQSCDFLSPVWTVPIFLGPPKLYSIAYPCLHFAITFERFRSTIFALKYEHMGTKLIVQIICIIWLVSFAYMAFIICTALGDPQISGRPQGIVTITTAQNADAMFYGTVVTMGMVTLTAAGDWCIFMLNKRIHRETRNNSTAYSLSLNYQLHENANAMLVIFPIDISYAVIYPLYNALVLIVRAYRSSLSTADFATYYYWANTPLFIHSLVTVLLYIRFINKFSSKKRTTKKGQKILVRTSPNEEATIYFQHLEAQWKKTSVSHLRRKKI